MGRAWRVVGILSLLAILGVLGAAAWIASRPLVSPRALVTPTPPLVETPARPSLTPVATRPGTPAQTSSPVPSPTPIPLASLPPTVNIVLLGSDHRPDAPTWRTDVMVVVAVEPEAKRVGVVAIPRDLWVTLPGFGENRINAADFIGEYYGAPGGGPGLVKRTIAENLKLPVDYYVRLDFDGFERIVDALGGVTVDVECPIEERFVDPASPTGLTDVNIQPGVQTMNGRTALFYVRARHATSDYDRVRRQQRLLLALRQQVLNLDIVPKVPALWLALNDAVQTDLGLPEILALARLGVEVKTSDIHGVIIDQTLTHAATSPEGYSILRPDQEKIRAAIANLFTAPPLADLAKRPWPCPK